MFKGLIGAERVRVTHKTEKNKKVKRWERERKRKEGRKTETQRKETWGGGFFFVCLFVEGKCKTSSLSSPHLWLYGGEE